MNWKGKRGTQTWKSQEETKLEYLKKRWRPSAIFTKRFLRPSAMTHWGLKCPVKLSSTVVCNFCFASNNINTENRRRILDRVGKIYSPLLSSPLLPALPPLHPFPPSHSSSHSSPPSPPLPCSYPLNPARGAGSAVSSPIGSGRSPAAKRFWCIFRLKSANLLSLA